MGTAVTNSSLTDEFGIHHTIRELCLQLKLITSIMIVSKPEYHYSNKLAEQGGITDVSENGPTTHHNKSSPPKPVRRLAEAPWSQESYHHHKPIQNLQNSQQVKLFVQEIQEKKM